MNKIPTIFERDWNGNRGVIDKWMVNLTESYGTEKVDGTNIRLTVRNHILVRVEKRRNPSKLEKAKGISEPWYIDADQYSPEDKWIYDAANAFELKTIEDGEWSGEAFGKNIQGNPLRWEINHVFLFSYPEILDKHKIEVPTLSFNQYKEWLSSQKSTFNSDVGIEGIVFWKDGEPIGKIKLKDFK